MATLNKWKLYTIECEGHGGDSLNPVYYVGKTRKSVEERFLEHVEQRDGAQWTGLHAPIRLVNNAGPSTIDPEDKFSEDTLVYRTMEIHGIDNVRGGSYCQIRLTNEQVQELSRKLTAATDRCYRCNAQGHFIKQCPAHENKWGKDANENKGEQWGNDANKSIDATLLPSVGGFVSMIGRAISGLFTVETPQAHMVRSSPPPAQPRSSYGKYRQHPQHHPQHHPHHAQHHAQHQTQHPYHARHMPAHMKKPYSKAPSGKNAPAVKATPVKPCYRCGRGNHYASECFAKTHLNGKAL